MDARIVDIFLLGPIQVLIGLYVKNPILKLFMIITGIANIIYNGHNFLYFQYGRDITPMFQTIVDPKHGKTQLHRIYNIVIMYPIFLYIYLTIQLPLWLKIIFFLDITIGFAFNLTNFILI